MTSAGGTTIAWIDAPGDSGTWGVPEQLALPLADRGLALADGLFETILIQNGKPQLLEAHLVRWRQSAARLGMEAPTNSHRVVPLLAEAIERSGSADAALRLNWSRGKAGRGIALLWPKDLQRSEAGLLINSLDCRPLQGEKPNDAANKALGPTAHSL